MVRYRPEVLPIMTTPLTVPGVFWCVFECTHANFAMILRRWCAYGGCRMKLCGGWGGWREGTLLKVGGGGGFFLRVEPSVAPQFCYLLPPLPPPLQNFR